MTLPSKSFLTVIISVLSLLQGVPTTTRTPQSVFKVHLDRVYHSDNTKKPLSLPHVSTSSVVPESGENVLDSHVTFPSRVLRQGLTFDSCSSAAECEGDRVCITINKDGHSLFCPSASVDCICFKQEGCNSEAECDDGETCFGNENEADAMCLSEQATLTGDKLNYEPCSTSSECAGDRLCKAPIDAEITLCSGRNDCYCEDLDARCSSDADCDDGERCAGGCVINAGCGMACTSNAVTVDEEPAGSPENPAAVETDSPEDSLSNGTSASKGGKLNLETCSSSDECAGDRSCFFPGVEEISLCSGQNDCFCWIRDARCSSDADCDDGESCAKGCVTNGKLCIEGCVSNVVKVEGEPDGSEDNAVPAETDSPDTGTTVCISAHHLSELTAKAMIYAEHRLARVLCDEHNSCATAGHMVRYEGRPMMMRSYCDLVGCAAKTHEVNSPKYVRGMLIESKSDGLMFTAFAGRYNSRFEEVVLHLAIRLGF